MPTQVAIAGSGPAAEALRAALGDVEATVASAEPSALGDADLAAVVAPAGADAFAAADDAADRWLAVEIGGVGGHAVDGVDAAVSAFDGSPGYADLRSRVAAGDPDTAGRPRGDRAAVRLAGALAGRRAVALLSGVALAGTVVEVTGAGVGPERTLLPVPTPGDRDRTLRRDGGTATLDDAVSRAERAVDDRVGPLSTVGEQESFPLPYYVATTSDTRAFSDARAAEYGGGADADWNRAFMKALGEGLERYCSGVYCSTAFVTAPATNRSAPVEPRTFVRPDDAPTPGPDEPIQWVPGESLETGEAVSLPAEFVHYPPPAERLAPPITTGLGLGNSGAEALAAGLAETVERDATMLAWYSTFDPLELAVDDDGYAELRGRARAMGLETTALLVTQDVDVPVVAAAVHRDGEWPAFAAGSGASLDPVAAARSALSEALQNWTELRGMGERRAANEQGAIGRYADFPSEVRRFLDADGPVPASSVGPADPPTGADALDGLVERVADAGLSPYAARLTTRDVAALGFEAVRVLVPAAQPLFTGEPFFGERARTVPESLGFEPRLDRAYHPFP